MFLKNFFHQQVGANLGAKWVQRVQWGVQTNFPFGALHPGFMRMILCWKTPKNGLKKRPLGANHFGGLHPPFLEKTAFKSYTYRLVGAKGANVYYIAPCFRTRTNRRRNRSAIAPATDGLPPESQDKGAQKKLGEKFSPNCFKIPGDQR